MLFSYEVLINVALDDRGFPSAKFCRFDGPSYLLGDPLVRTWRGEMSGEDSLSAAWAVVDRHNRDDRPDGRVGPSFSQGDVVVLTPVDAPSESVAYASMHGLSLEPVSVPDPSIVETSRSWRDVTAALVAAAG